MPTREAVTVFNKIASRASRSTDAVNVVILGPPHAGKTVLLAALYNSHHPTIDTNTPPIAQDNSDASARIIQQWDDIKNQGLLPARTREETPEYYSLEIPTNEGGTIEVNITSLPGEQLLNSNKGDATSTEPANANNESRTTDTAIGDINVKKTLESLKAKYSPDILVLVVNPYLCRSSLTTRTFLGLIHHLQSNGKTFGDAILLAAQALFGWPHKKAKSELPAAAKHFKKLCDLILAKPESLLGVTVVKKPSTGEFSVEVQGSYTGPSTDDFGSSPAKTLYEMLVAIATTVANRHGTYISVMKGLLKRFPQSILVLSQLDLELVVRSATPADIDAIKGDFFNESDLLPHQVIAGGNLSLRILPDNTLGVIDLQNDFAARFEQSLLKTITLARKPVPAPTLAQWSDSLSIFIVLLPIFAILSSLICIVTNAASILPTVVLAFGLAAVASILLPETRLMHFWHRPRPRTLVASTLAIITAAFLWAAHSRNIATSTVVAQTQLPPDTSNPKPSIEITGIEQLSNQIRDMFEGAREDTALHALQDILVSHGGSRDDDSLLQLSSQISENARIQSYTRGRSPLFEAIEQHRLMRRATAYAKSELLRQQDDIKAAIPSCKTALDQFTVDTEAPSSPTKVEAEKLRNSLEEISKVTNTPKGDIWSANTIISEVTGAIETASATPTGDTRNSVTEGLRRIQDLAVGLNKATDKYAQSKKNEAAAVGRLIDVVRDPNSIKQ